MEHSKEPWATKGAMVYSAEGKFISTIAIPDARRIVACVNKLAGWPIEDLEDPEVQIAKIMFDLSNQPDFSTDIVFKEITE